MYDHNYDLENEVIQEENDYETGENGNHRPFTSDQSLTGKRQKVKTNNFYGIQSVDRLPVVYPQHRPYSDKGVKLSSNGSRMGQNSSFKSQDRSSYLIAKDLEYDQPNKILSSPKRFLVMAPSGPQKNSKLIPKNIPQDKERLYDENMSLKNILHSLREENLKLKTKVLIFEKDAVKYEKMMADQDGGFVEREFVPKANDSHLLVGLKNKLIEVENTLQEKEAELSKLKKSVKVTKINEMEVQLKISTEESYRLKGILDQLLKEKSQHLSKNENKAKLQEECMIQAAQIKALEKDHEQLVKIIKSFEQQSAEYEKKISELEKKKRSETQKLKKLVAEKEKENRKLKEEDLKLKQEVEVAYSHLPVCKTSMGTKRPISSKEDMLIQELEKKRTENLGLMDQLTEKNNQIQQLEKKLKNAAKNDKPPTLTSLERPVAGFRKKSERFTQPILLNVANVEEIPVAETKPQPQTKVEKPDQQIPTIAIETKPENANEEDEVESVSQDLENDIQESGRIPSVQRKRVQKVRAEDVKELGYRINLCLRTTGITFDDLNKTVWPDYVVQTGRLRIIEAIEILADEPFNLPNEEDATMIARYLIEDNHEDYLFYDPETEGDLVIVKSILRKLIGTIPIWNKETTKKLHDSVSEIISKNHLSFRENLRVICKDGNLNKKALQEVCKIVEVSMSDEQLEFIITKLFEKTNDTLAMPIEGLFEVFYRKPQTPEPVQQPIQINAPVSEKKPEPLSLSSGTKQNYNDFTIPESKPFQKVNESPLRNKTPPQETILKEEPIKAKIPQEVEIPKIKQLETPKKVEEERVIQDIESEANLEEEDYAETPRQNKEQEQSEQSEDDYHFEEEEQDKNHNQVTTPPSNREEKVHIPESTKRSESQPTSKNQNEDRKENDNEDYLDLNPTTEREEAGEIERNPPAEKSVKEQNQSEDEYQDDAEEEIEEEDEKENLSLKNNGKGVKAEKNEAGDEEYDNEDMGFEEIEDDA